MQEPPSYTTLADATGIGRPHAHDIVKGRRQPSQRLAIRIFRATGWKHDRIERLSDETIAELEQASA